MAEKYPSLKVEYAELIDTLEQQPNLGTPIGHDCYKIRLAIASKGKGKSGSARIITYMFVAGKTVFLLSIYNKGEQDDISDKELLSMLNNSLITTFRKKKVDTCGQHCYWRGLP